MALIKPIAGRGGSGTRPMVTFCYDDGGSTDYDVVFPLFKQYGVRGTFFANEPSHILTEVGLEGELKAKEMADAGQEIGSHTSNHPFLNQLTRAEMIPELLNSKKQIEAITGKPCLTLGIPNGGYNDDVLVMLEGFFEAGRSSDEGLNDYGNNNTHNLKTYFLDNAHVSVDTIKSKVYEAVNTNKWLIISMHKVIEKEEDRTGPWQVLKSELVEILDYIDTFRPYQIDVVPFYEGARRIKS